MIADTHEWERQPNPSLITERKRDGTTKGVSSLKWTDDNLAFQAELDIATNVQNINPIGAITAATAAVVS